MRVIAPEHHLEAGAEEHNPELRRNRRAVAPRQVEPVDRTAESSTGVLAAGKNREDGIGIETIKISVHERRRELGWRPDGDAVFMEHVVATGKRHHHCSILSGGVAAGIDRMSPERRVVGGGGLPTAVRIDGLVVFS
jgi:hypothetical protein